MRLNPGTVYWMDNFFTYLFSVKCVMYVWKDKNKWNRGRRWCIFLKKVSKCKRVLFIGLSLGEFNTNQFAVNCVLKRRNKEKRGQGSAAIAQWFVCAYHPATPGSSPKHTIYAFIIYRIYAYTIYLSRGKNESKEKRGREWPNFFKKCEAVGFAFTHTKGSTKGQVILTLHFMIVLKFNNTPEIDLFRTDKASET